MEVGILGPALNEHPDRTQEEIDVVGLNRRRLMVVGECKWTSPPMDLSVLTDLTRFKLPAIIHKQNVKPPRDGPRILLFSRTGFSNGLRAEADRNQRIELIELIELDELVETLLAN